MLSGWNTIDASRFQCDCGQAEARYEQHRPNEKHKRFAITLAVVHWCWVFDVHLSPDVKTSRPRRQRRLARTLCHRFCWTNSILLRTLFLVVQIGQMRLAIDDELNSFWQRMQVRGLWSLTAID